MKIGVRKALNNFLKRMFIPPKEDTVVSWIKGGAKIGKDVQIGPGVDYIGGFNELKLLTIEDGTIIAAYTKIILHDAALSVHNLPSKFSRVHIGKKAFIGANSTIMCGVNIGDGAIIGAGSVVTKDVQPYSLAIGNPAKVVGTVNDLKKKLGEEMKREDKLERDGKKRRNYYFYSPWPEPKKWTSITYKEFLKSIKK